jgi:dipeptidyl aminopeptidase/acylaminoacyl peptidase
VQNGYWAFGHNPMVYASSVKCPALLLFGEQDDRVSREETDALFDNLKGPKTLKAYPREGHNVFSDANRQTWIDDVTDFVTALP